MSASEATGIVNASERRGIISKSEGTGLWIGVRGGLGVETLTVPEDGRPHAYPFGHAIFTVQAFPNSNGFTYQWTAPGGAPLPSGKAPYQMWFDGVNTPPPGRGAAQTLRLTPSALASRFQVTAQPLSADGRPVGRAVSLACQPVTANALFAQIPVGYSARTRQFRVTVARVGTKSRGASWQITDLPPSTRNGPDDLPPTPAARVGPFVLRAIATESEDTSGILDPMTRHPVTLEPPSQNLDGHEWTGVPTIRCLLTARRRDA